MPHPWYTLLAISSLFGFWYTVFMKTQWKDKNIAIIGLGIEGVSSARYFKGEDCNVSILDRREKKDLDPVLVKEIEDLGVELKLGTDYLSSLEDFQVVVRSPGVKKNIPELIEAEKKGIFVTSQIKLFFDLCPGLIIGVTGTKGKGTTSTLIYEMLKKSGFDAYLGGNIGNPPFSFLSELNEQSRVVLELSSFQLQDLSKSPHIAVMLMIVPEHMDYHESLEEYVEAKRNILRFQRPTDFAVVNRDYVPSLESDVHTDGKVFYVSRERPSTEQGCFVKDEAIWMRMEGAEWKIIDLADIKLPGKHNVENVSAAAMAATLAGTAKADIYEVLHTFEGLPHRLELVREHEGVKYYDDSFSTTPETAMAAIEAFTSPEVLILGGSSKNSDFTELGRVITESRNIKAIIGIGVEWSRVKEAIDMHAKGVEPILMIEGARDMESVVAAASKIAKPGDVVILSPACASFDMFKNYKERGEKYKEEVLKL